MNYNYYKFVPGDDMLNHAYSAIVEQAKEGDILCEIGCGMGRSTCFMMESLQEKESKAKFYAFDLFGVIPEPIYGDPIHTLTPWGEQIDRWAQRVGGVNHLLDSFHFYITNCPAREYLYDYAQFPACIGEEFADGSVRFVSLNTLKTFSRTLDEIALWSQKIRKDGQILIPTHGLREFFFIEDLERFINTAREKFPNLKFELTGSEKHNLCYVYISHK